VEQRKESIRGLRASANGQPSSASNNDMATIDLNTATVKALTQLPGISKHTAYLIVNHRNRHGYFTAWEELNAVREFPKDKLEQIKTRAVLGHPGEEAGAFAPPRHLEHRLEEQAKKPKGYTRAIRGTRSTDKLRQAAGPRH